MTRSTRRLAALLALLLLGAGLAGWGLSLAAASSLGGERVGTPRHGDRWTYETPEGIVELRWNGTRDVHDEWGRAFRADVLEERTAEGPRLFLYPGGASEPEATIGIGGRIMVGSGEAASSPLAQQTGSMEGTLASFWYRSGHHPAGWACAAVAAWQGTPLRDVASVDVHDACSRRNGDAQLRARGLEEVGGLLAQRFDFVIRGATQSAVWLAPDVPYAVAFTECAPSCPDPESAHYRLVAYEPGDGAALGAADWRGDAPQRVGEYMQLPPSGVHPDSRSEFTAEKALAAIADDEGLEAHHEWRRTHADATLVLAHYSWDLADEGDDRRESWTFGWLSDDGTSSVVVSEEDGQCLVHPRLPLASSQRESGLCQPLNREGGMGPCDPACRPLRSPGPLLTFDSAIAMFEERRYQVEFPLWTHSMRLMRQGDHVHGLITVSSVASTGAPRGLDPLGMNGGPAAVSAEAMAFDAFTGRLLSHTFIMDATTVWTAHPGWIQEATDPAAAPHRSVESFGGSTAWLPPSGISATSTAVGAGILLALGAMRALPALAVFYSRLRRQSVSSHPRRAAILDALRNQPGASIAELADLTGIRGGALRYHLATLERARFLVRIEAGREARHYLAGSASPVALTLDAVLKADGAEARMLALLLGEPGLHASELARRLGVSRAAATRVARVLQRRGLVRAEGEGRSRRLYAVQAPATAVAAVG